MDSKFDFHRIGTQWTKTELHRALLHYHQQSQRLQQMNDLYRRIAGVLDLPALVEAYSIWLDQFVGHDLLGFRDLESGRTHLFCSEHGPEKRDNITLAEQLMGDPAQAGDLTATGVHSHICLLETRIAATRLLFLRQGEPFTASEIPLINDSLEILTQPLHNSIEYETVFQQARRDALTGLPNRLVLEERLPSLLEQARRHNRPLTLAALDLDHFKSVNDTLGHLRGDEVLKKVTAAFSSQIRGSDLLVRMGGDEFLLILPDTAMDAARCMSERLCEAVSALRVRAGERTLGVSIGIRQWQRDMSAEEWLEQADDLLYQAKKNGRSRVMQ